MKYNANNKPLICMQTQSTCYKGTKPMTVKGVLWHSTGANNPNLCRYIQPGDNATDRIQMLKLLGTNKYHNDINHKTRNMGMNAWIGKLADGSVAAVQTMPWNWAPWGCGASKRGSCNSAWIQFEICEDGLNNRDYAMAVYREACELTAYLCRMFGLDPHGSVRFNGVDVPVILDHRTSHALGLGNNHGDIAHWFPKFGKTLETIRDDVAALMGVDAQAEGPFYDDDPIEAEILLGTRLLKKGLTGDDVKRLQELLNQLHIVTPALEEDGNFGSKTDAAVRSFQKKLRLKEDGLYGQDTHRALMGAVTDDVDKKESEPAADLSEAGQTVEEKPSGKDTTAVITIVCGDGTVDIRVGNSTDFACITAAENGARFPYIATAANGWHAVLLDSQVGWVSGKDSQLTDR